MKIIFVYSVPRSGSTYFTKLLENKKGYVVMPETYLHLALLSKDFIISEKSINSCMPDGFPITNKEIYNSIKNSEDKLRDFICLLQRKFNPEYLVLKSTRLLGYANLINLNFECRSIWIDRNPLNIYESLTRVSFGKKNSNPFRFAVWYNSYYYSRTRLNSEIVCYSESVKYIRNLPEGITVLKSYSSKYHSTKSWHSNLNKSFNNTDLKKLDNLSNNYKLLIQLSILILKLFNPFFNYLRISYDKKMLRKINKAII